MSATKVVSVGVQATGFGAKPAKNRFQLGSGGIVLAEQMAGGSIGFGSDPSGIYGANLKRWYKENYTAATGVYVDETGNFNSSQSNAPKRPALGSINGHPCPVFTGVEGLKIGGGTGGAPFTTECTIGGVFTTSSFAATAYIVAKTFGAEAFGVGAANVGSKLEAWVNSSTSPVPAKSNSNLDDGNPHDFIMNWDGSTVTLYIAGVAQTVTQAKASPMTDSTDFMSLGCGMFTSDGTIAYPFIGTLGNIVIVNRASTPTEISELSSYLRGWA